MPSGLDRRFYIGLAEVVADEEQRTIVSPGNCVGKTVAEVERGSVTVAPPLRVGLSDASCLGFINGDDFKIEPRQQVLHRISHVSAMRNKQSLRERSG